MTMVELGLSKLATTRPRRTRERASEIWMIVGASERERSTRAVIL
jgi:hypothetical protein